MRRLPVYMLIDVSESMVGEPIKCVEEGISSIIQSLKTDPNVIETVWICIIVFAGKAKTIVPLQEIMNYYPPKIPVGSGTSLGVGISQLMHELSNNQVKTTVEKKGDWKPVIFLFTDGVPTDNLQDLKSVTDEWKNNWRNRVNMIAVSFGNNADINILSELTDNLLDFDNGDADDYKKFFQWITDSIKTCSVNVSTKNNDYELCDIKSEILSRIDLTKAKIPVFDDNYIVLVGRCQNTKRPYLIKYKKYFLESDSGDNVYDYKLEGAYQIDNIYFELSDEVNNSLSISSEKLSGAPVCPWCSNNYAFAVCDCGKLHCIGGENLNTCPWCSHQGYYSSDGEAFEVNRRKG